MEVLAFGPATAPEVAEALKIHPRTARRLLNRLVADGWVTRTDGHRRRYAPSMRLTAMAAQFSARLPLVEHGAPYVDALHTETGHQAFLAIPSYTSVLTLLRSAGLGQPTSPRELLTPANDSAAGTVLLAYRDRWRESVIQLQATSSNGSAEEQLVAFADVRAQGFAIATEGSDGRAVEIAVPVRGAGGDVDAALALRSRDGTDLGPFLAGLQRSAQAIAQELVDVADRAAHAVTSGEGR